jgi:hypothetical protein
VLNVKAVALVADAGVNGRSTPPEGATSENTPALTPNAGSTTTRISTERPIAAPLTPVADPTGTWVATDSAKAASEPAEAA